MRLLTFMLALCGLVSSAHAQAIRIPPMPVVDASAPAYVAEAGRSANSSSLAAHTITLSNAVGVGQRIVVLASWVAADATPPTITDTRGNTYASHVVGTRSTSRQGMVASAHVATALQVGDTVTLTYGGAVGSFAGSAQEITGAASSGQPDVTASSNGFGSSVSATATTVADNTVIVGIVVAVATSGGETEGTTTTIGEMHTSGSTMRNFYKQTTRSSAGSFSSTSTLPGNENWLHVWAAFN